MLIWHKRCLLMWGIHMTLDPFEIYGLGRPCCYYRGHNPLYCGIIVAMTKNHDVAAKIMITITNHFLKPWWKYVMSERMCRGIFFSKISIVRFLLQNNFGYDGCHAILGYWWIWSVNDYSCGLFQIMVHNKALTYMPVFLSWLGQ